MQLIPARREELDALQEIYWTLLDSAPEYETTLRWKKNIYPTRQDWLHYITRGEMYFLTQDGQTIGAAALSREQADSYRTICWSAPVADGEVAVIHLFALLPEHQGKGYAKKALQAIAAHAKAAGIKSLRLDAISTNLHAQKLYESFGFHYCGREKLYYESTGMTDFLFYEYLL